MAYKNISDNVESLCRLVENWNRKGCASELERDLMLDKLKRLYEQVLSMELKSDRAQDAQEVVRTGDNAAAPEPACDTEDIDFTVGTAAGDAEEQINEEIISAAEGNELPADGEPEETGAIEAEIREETVIDSPSFAGAVSENARGAAAEEPLHAKSRIDKSVLRSLYDDESNMAPDMPRSETVREPAGNGDSIKKEEPVGEAGVQQAAEKAERGKPTADPETLGAQPAPSARKLTPDRHSMPPPSSGIATRMMPTSLKQYMGLNDKFILLSDLFDSNSTLYERAIYDLDSMTSLDDAMLYVLDNFAHKQHTDGAKLLVDLLVRKLM